MSARDPSGLLLAVVATTGIGLLGANTLPLLLGSVMDRLAIGESRGGLMGTVELGALALVSLLVAPRVGRLRRSSLALLGGGLVVVGYAAAARAGFLPDLPVPVGCHRSARPEGTLGGRRRGCRDYWHRLGSRDRRGNGGVGRLSGARSPRRRRGSEHCCARASGGAGPRPSSYQSRGNPMRAVRETEGKRIVWVREVGR